MQLYLLIKLLEIKMHSRCEEVHQLEVIHTGTTISPARSDTYRYNYITCCDVSYMQVKYFTCCDMSNIQVYRYNYTTKNHLLLN